MTEAPPRHAEQLAADAVGDVIQHWGFRKALGRVWTILYLEGAPLSAQELCDRLSMSTGGMNTTLNELGRWGVVHRVWRPGERKDFFEAETDFWKMISRVVGERERHLAVSVRERLDEAAAILKKTDRARFDRLKRLMRLADVAESTIETFLVSRRVDFRRLAEVLTRGRSS